jgi:mRNA interferase MazF
VSQVMVDKITTVSRTKLGARIGSLEGSDMPGINRAIALFLGLASPSQ